MSDGLLLVLGMVLAGWAHWQMFKRWFRVGSARLDSQIADALDGDGRYPL